VPASVDISIRTGELIAVYRAVPAGVGSMRVSAERPQVAAGVLGLVECDGAIQLVDRKLERERGDRHALSRPLFGGVPNRAVARDDGDLRSAVGNEQHRS
jgi:hypothetical protein